MKPNFKTRRPRKLSALLGLALDGSRLEGVVLKRNNGALERQQNFSAVLALDPLTAAPELVAREIRNHLDAAGIHERHCVLGLPLKWVLTVQTELPELAEADALNLLQMEAERGFHADLATLQTTTSRCRLPEGKKLALIAGIPGTHLTGMEKVLALAKLKPVSFTLGISTLVAQSAAANGGLALVIGESHVGLQIIAGGGVAALRALEGAVEAEAGRRTLHTEMVAREVRITLGQLPASLRDEVKTFSIFGPAADARTLADVLTSRFGPQGIRVDVVAESSGNSPSTAFSLATQLLGDKPPVFEFLPPKPGLLEQLATKYSSGRLRTIGAIGAGVGLLLAITFGWQQFELWQLRSKWSAISAKVQELNQIQGQIRQYRPWYDTTFPNLSILRQLTLAFSEDGAVTAKNIEIRDGNTVTCSGTARDYASLLAMQAKLCATPGISGVKLEQGRSKAPIQFVFAFKFSPRGANEN